MFHCVVLTCGVIWPNDQFKNGIPAVGETDWLLLEEHFRSSRQILAAKVANNISQLLLCPLIETPTPGEKNIGGFKDETGKCRRTALGYT